MTAHSDCDQLPHGWHAPAGTRISQESTGLQDRCNEAIAGFEESRKTRVSLVVMFQGSRCICVGALEQPQLCADGWRT